MLDDALVNALAALKAILLTDKHSVALSLLMRSVAFPDFCAFAAKCSLKSLR